MNPFLERLAARSLEAMPVLQPRRASRFETTDTSGALDPDPGLGAQPIAQVGVPALTAQPPAATSVPGSPMAAGPLPMRREGIVNLADSLPAPLPRPAADQPDREVHPEPTPLLVPPEPSILIQRVHVPAPLAEPRQASHLGNGPVRELQPLLVNAPQASLPAEPRPLRSRDGGAPAPSPRLERQEDIHISIGRIEIRAVAPKTDSPSKRTPPGSPSSLDTYLQRRNGRGNP